MDDCLNRDGAIHPAWGRGSMAASRVLDLWNTENFCISPLGGGEGWAYNDNNVSVLALRH
jgi:hypothetical protein